MGYPGGGVNLNKVKMDKNFVDLDNARVEEQKQVMRDIIEAGHCPFCAQNLKKYHQLPIIKESKYWLLTTNQWPYKNTKFHFLAIYKQHVTKLQQINPLAGRELIELFTWLEKEYQIRGGGWVMRFGETKYSAGSVSHLHAQFIVPDLESDNYQPIRVKIGKSTKDFN